MSDPLISILTSATSQVYIYMGTAITIAGVFGGIVNVIIFLSLQIYRQSSSAFYLTIVSIVNIGQLLTGLLSRVLINIFNIDWTENSSAYCKIRNYVFQACAIISPICLCLAIIDQFLATSTRPQWQRWSNTMMAHRLTMCAVIFWLLYGIPYLVYYNLFISSTTGKSTCVITNTIFQQYYNDFHVPVLLCVIPLFTMIIFASLAYYNIRQVGHRTVPLVRRRHEVQLTVMVLVQVVFNFFATTPCFIVLIFASQTTLTTDPLIAIQVRFAIAVTTCIYYLYYAIPFYIYICVSERFRKQLYHVFFVNRLNRWQRPITNEVAPEVQLDHIHELPKVVIETIE